MPYLRRESKTSARWINSNCVLRARAAGACGCAWRPGRNWLGFCITSTLRRSVHRPVSGWGMHSASSFAATLSAEAALLAAGLAIAMALGFIFARRLLRSRYFRLRDVRVQYIRRNWEKIVDGEIVPESWFCTPMD